MPHTALVPEEPEHADKVACFASASDNRLHWAAMKLRFSHSVLLSAVLVVALVGVMPVAAAPSAPTSAKVASSQTALNKALRDNERARASVDEASRRVAAASARLDRLVADQNRTQSRLDAQAVATYRLGDASFITLLFSATNFDDFVSRWFFLTRVNQQSAATLVAIKADRQRTARSAHEILLLQTRASADLRALDTSVARARAELQNSSAAYAEFQRRTAAAASARAAAAASRAEATAAAARLSARRPASAPSPKTVSGSTPPASTQGWRSALVSNYGPGSYGHRTADGTVISADSMIVAHKTLPFGTLVEFEYGGRRAVAVVADRGPYVAGREFDLGPGVARTLGLNGVYTVQYRIVGR